MREAKGQIDIHIEGPMSPYSNVGRGELAKIVTKQQTYAGTRRI